MVDHLRNLHLLVEGQMERTVAAHVLMPYLETGGFSISMSILVTSRPAGQSSNRGGVSRWTKIAEEVRKLLGNSSLDLLTTMIDCYAFPADAPGMASRPASSPLERVRHVEAAVAEAVGDPRFVPHLVLHELEAWVFAAGRELAELRGKPALAATLQREVDAVGGAEMINDGPQTAPSKRLARHCPDYNKTSEGPDTIEALGVGALRRACPHVDHWLDRLDAGCLGG